MTLVNIFKKSYQIKNLLRESKKLKKIKAIDKKN